MGHQISDAERERRAYAEQQAAIAWQRKQAAAAEAEAARDRRELQRQIDAIAAQGRKDVDAWGVWADREIQAQWADYTKRKAGIAAENTKLVQDDEKAKLGQPRTVRTGATHALPGALPVFHFKAGMSAANLSPRLDENPAGDGPIVYLRAGGGIPATHIASAVLVSKRPEIRGSEAHAAWHRETLMPVLADARKRYPVLAKLRADDWWAEVAEAAGLADVTHRVDRHQGTEQVVEQKVTISNIPSLTGVRISPEGLELTYHHRIGDSPERWARALPVLRTAFRAAGVDAENLSVTTTATGDIRLDFNDAPNTFPPAIAPEPPERPVRDRADAIARYKDAAWVLGVDARGRELRYPMGATPHVLVAGGTGGGKSVWARTTIELLRAGNGFTCFIASGKVSDFAALEGLPGIAMVAGGAAQTAVMVRRVRREMDRRNAAAADAKRAGSGDAFAFPPILVLLDEWGATAMMMSQKYGKSASSFTDDIDLLLRVGREARIHVVLLSQTIRKTGAGMVPGSWQENLGLTVSLGEPSSITLLSDAFTESTRPIAERIGNRLKGKQGRGLIAERESGRVVEFQSYYGWSPGTTSLDPTADPKVRPPTPEVRQVWERWVPISDSVPWILPRIGIKCAGPEWSDGGDLNVVADTTTVALTDAAGNVKPGMAVYDPADPSWRGRPDPTAVMGTHDALEFDEGETGTPPPPAPTRVAPTPPTPPAESAPAEAPADGVDVSDPVRAWALANGLIPEGHPDHPGAEGVSPAETETTETPAPTPAANVDEEPDEW